MEENKPRNIFEAINKNVVDMSYDLVKVYERVASIEEKVEQIYLALYPPLEQPNATGDASTENK